MGSSITRQPPRPSMSFSSPTEDDWVGVCKSPCQAQSESIFIVDSSRSVFGSICTQCGQRRTLLDAFSWHHPPPFVLLIVNPSPRFNQLGDTTTNSSTLTSIIVKSIFRDGRNRVQRRILKIYGTKEREDWALQIQRNKDSLTCQRDK